MNNKFLLKAVISFLIVFPSATFGQIIFSEIMYDPTGTDGGYEWVEIYNTSQYSKNLEKYKFCEGRPTCHNWAKDSNNNFSIPGNGYAVITDDFDKFHEKNNFDGLVLVSTGFTLTNTGELIQMKNEDGDLDDSLVFNPVSGGGNGQTLSLFDGLWKNSENTAGKVNIEKRISDTNDSGSGSDSGGGEVIHTSYVEVSDMFLGKKKLRAEIDEVGVVMAGSRVKFTGTAYGITGVEITGIEFLWNFGDGARGEGQFDYHEYDFPNDYIVTLVVKSGNFTGNAKVRIQVINPALEISYVQIKDEDTKGYIRLKNNSGEILNIEDWMLSVDGERFLIPDNTYIDRYADIIFSESVTHLQPINRKNKKSRVAILFPNGERFFDYDWNKGKSNLEKEKLGEEAFYNRVATEDVIEKIQEEDRSIKEHVPVLILEDEEVVEKKPVQKTVVKKTTKKKVVKKYHLPEGASLVPFGDDILESDKDERKSVREMVLAKAGNKEVRPESNTLDQATGRTSSDKKQGANIFSAFTATAHGSENGMDNFIKNNWPFLSFLGILIVLIGGILYMRNREFLEQENLENESGKGGEEKQLDIMEEIKSEAAQFEIEDISEKK